MLCANNFGGENYRSLNEVENYLVWFFYEWFEIEIKYIVRYFKVVQNGIA